jgi:putative transposase
MGPARAAVASCSHRTSPTACLRTIVNALLYELRSGCAWRLLPVDWPPWQTVYYYLRKWRRDGTLERIHTILREQLRRALGRDPQPSAGSVDS